MEDVLKWLFMVFVAVAVLVTMVNVAHAAENPHGADAAAVTCVSEAPAGRDKCWTH